MVRTLHVTHAVTAMPAGTLLPTLAQADTGPRASRPEKHVPDALDYDN